MPDKFENDMIKMKRNVSNPVHSRLLGHNISSVCFQAVIIFILLGLISSVAEYFVLATWFQIDIFGWFFHFILTLFKESLQNFVLMKVMESLKNFKRFDLLIYSWDGDERKP